MRKEDLVVLCFSNNPCSTNVVPLDEGAQDLTVDIKKGVFYQGSGSFMIGKDRIYYSIGCWPKNGVIGIYDRTNLEHLSKMVHHAREATTDHRGSAFDD